MRLSLSNLSGRAVRPHNLQPQLTLGILIAYGVGLAHGLKRLRITSLADGTHSYASLHYAGAAFDIGFEPDMDIQKFADDLRADLGIDFDVVVETNHIHVEYQTRLI